MTKLLSREPLSGADWFAVADMVKGHPSPMLAIYASVASALLEVIPNAPNAILGWCGQYH